MVDEKVDENKRRFLKALAGGIAGLSIPMSIYEVLIIPELQRRFIKELEYWMNEYKLADEKLKELQSKYETSDNTLTNLKQFENELNEQIKLYSQKKDEAINKIKETINKYEILVGGEASFEKGAVKILEDLKIKGDKLLKVYKHLPAIVDLYWKPTKIINDKIYDINVSFEVISPLNSLKEVEVMLIPVEYRYFITSYGMREEDYGKVFPKEEVRSVKIEPKKLEEEMFSVDFKDLKVGREYLLKAVAKDVGDRVKDEEIKISYIRKYENLGKYARISVIPFYYTWHLPGLWKNVPYRPLLGTYDSHNPLVLDIHIDEITGYGMNTICIEWVGGNDWTVDNIKNNLLKNSNLINSNDIRWFLLYDPVATGRLIFDEKGFINVDNQHNRSIIINDFEELSYYFTHPTYYKSRDGRPYVFLYLYRALKGDVEGLVEEIKKKYNPYIVGDLVYWQLPEELIHAKNIAQYVDSISAYSMYLSNPNILSHNVFLKEVETRFKLWSDYAKQINKDFAPSVIPGYNDQLLRGNKNPVLERSVEFFRRQLEMAERYSTGSIYVCTFNVGPEATASREQ
jgi:hypothetical protein